MAAGSVGPGGAFGALRRLAARPGPEERCDLCSEPLRPEHRHLLDLQERRVTCACDPCSILFSSGGSGRYRAIQHRIRFMPDFAMPDEVWDGLGVPISVAFFQHAIPSGQVVALYPGPAGATESLLTFDAWEELERLNPLLRQMEPGVEALLVNRMAGARDHFLVSVDECYRLAGLIRVQWRGLSGGTEVWKGIAAFFDELRGRAEGAARSHA